MGKAVLFSKIRDENKEFKCDSCSGIFPAKDIKLQDPADNIQILTPIMMPFVYIDKDDVITGGSKQASREKGDKILACPLCDTPHLFGFDRVL